MIALVVRLLLLLLQLLVLLLLVVLVVVLLLLLLVDVVVAAIVDVLAVPPTGLQYQQRDKRERKAARISSVGRARKSQNCEPRANSTNESPIFRHATSC